VTNSLAVVDPRKTMKNQGTLRDLCKYDVVLWFSLALQQTGVGSKQASILAYVLD
jgi:hypothetical protein